MFTGFGMLTAARRRDGNSSAPPRPRGRPLWPAVGWLVVLLPFLLPAHAGDGEATEFKRIPTQFIAALGDPAASAGTGAQAWGLWRRDPGPRGVWLDNFGELRTRGDMAPADWRFDPSNWWLDENGLIMEQPDFPVPPGQYVVTGDRDVAAVLTIHPAGADGQRRWELAGGATLHDVTHLPCRSARYTPAAGKDSCTPANARKTDFPVAPGAAMPAVEGCHKQDYSVLFVIGVPADR